MAMKRGLRRDSRAELGEESDSVGLHAGKLGFLSLSQPEKANCGAIFSARSSNEKRVRFGDH